MSKNQQFRYNSVHPIMDNHADLLSSTYSILSEAIAVGSAAGSGSNLTNSSYEYRLEDLSTSTKEVPAKKKRTWKKPKGMPKRPLSAYNLFFADERQKILDARKEEEKTGNVGFAGLAKAVAAKWKTMSEEDKKEFTEVAAKEQERYRRELSLWRAQEEKKKDQMEDNSSSGSLQTETPAAFHYGRHESPSIPLMPSMMPSMHQHSSLLQREASLAPSFHDPFEAGRPPLHIPPMASSMNDPIHMVSLHEDDFKTHFDAQASLQNIYQQFGNDADCLQILSNLAGGYI